MRQAIATLALVLLATTTGRAEETPDARRALDAFLRAYWDPQARVVYRDSEHGGGTPSDYWWSAHILETLTDAQEATGAYRAQLDAFYDGFVALHPDWQNDWNDDIGWWALALLRAYEVTGEARFKERGIALFQSIGAFEDSTYGGGIWWKRNGDAPQKGLPISAPWIMSAVRIAALTGDTSTLAAAKREYAWLESRFYSPDGRVNDHIEGPGQGTVIEWQLTYDYGTWIGASLALYDATGDRSYYEKAVKAAHYATEHLTKDGIFQNEGDDDGAGFKMILTRYLADLAARGEKWLVPVLRKNAETAWSNRRDDDLMGTDWSAKAPSGPIQSFAAVSAVDLQFHAGFVGPEAPLRAFGVAVSGAFRKAISNLRFALLRTAGPVPAASAENPGVTTVEAENGALEGLGTESTRKGFSGEGYVAGWDRDGQSVALTVTVPRDGDYVLALRYSAEAGDAARSLTVNGGGATRVAFPGTASWDDYRTVSVPRVALHAGENTIRVAYSSRAGSRAYLNLDRIAVAAAPGAAPSSTPPPPSRTRGVLRALGE